MLSSNYHLEMNPSDVGHNDRYVVQASDLLTCTTTCVSQWCRRLHHLVQASDQVFCVPTTARCRRVGGPFFSVRWIFYREEGKEPERPGSSCAALLCCVPAAVRCRRGGAPCWRLCWCACTGHKLASSFGPGACSGAYSSVNPSFVTCMRYAACRLLRGAAMFWSSYVVQASGRNGSLTGAPPLGG